MKEFNEFLDFCYTRYCYLENPCNQCTNGNYCTNNLCAHGDCSFCLQHILWSSNPQFHYPCKRITYYYVLRFFNRFASEIKEFFRVKFNANQLTIASLGCGPASELFGLVDGIRTYNPNVKNITYLGYDYNNIWTELNNKAREIFNGDTSIDIRFHQNNMFTNWQDQDIDKVNILLLNYLLSDCIRYQNNINNLRSFLDNIVNFIISYKVKIIVCNDISLFGYSNLDSSVRCMDYIKENLYNSGVFHGIRHLGFYYPSDKFKPNLNHWHEITDESLLFTQNPLYSQFTTNINRRASKYIILITDFK